MTLLQADDLTEGLAKCNGNLLSVGFMIHINCRMTVSRDWYSSADPLRLTYGYLT